MRRPCLRSPGSQRKPLQELEVRGQAWWLTNVMPALWEAKVGRPPEFMISRPA